LEVELEGFEDEEVGGLVLLLELELAGVEELILPL
jgi:hypothetical protein